MNGENNMYENRPKLQKDPQPDSGQWQQGSSPQSESGQWQQGSSFQSDNSQWQQGSSPQSDNGQWQQGSSPQPDYNQQGSYSQPDYSQQNYSQQNYSQPSSGFGIASMVCGILALITCCLWCTCIPLAVVSIVLGILQIQKGTAKGMAIAGIVCSSIGLILFIALTIYGNYLQSSGLYNEIMRELQMEMAQ